MDSPSPRRPDLTYVAPVGPVDLAAVTDEGVPYEIWPCRDCLPWHAEVIIEENDTFVREWHAVECPSFQELIARDAT